MTETLFEQFGGTYIKQGDYLMPNLTLPAEEEIGDIGVWATRHKRYLKQHHKLIYYNLLTSGTLHSHLADTEEQAQALFSRLDTIKNLIPSNPVAAFANGNMLQVLVFAARQRYLTQDFTL